MSRSSTTLLKRIYDLRVRKLIPRVWRVPDIKEFLEGDFSPNTLNVYPSNYSISMEDMGIGNSVKNRQDPKMWRVGRGQFRLIQDPDDDKRTQEDERNRAKTRAEELRSLKMRAGVRQDEHPRPIPGPHYRTGAQVESQTASSDRYPSIPVTLTPSERQYLAGLSAEERAVSIVREHLSVKYRGQAEIENDPDGADLRVSVDGRTERIEVKGTNSPSIAWQQLKVSSKRSHDALKNGEASMYRVVDVDGEEPRICILTYGQHFTLEPEPRWAVKRVPLEDDRYPLRGEPYRYHSPYEPVAMDDWEVRE